MKICWLTAASGVLERLGGHIALLAVLIVVPTGQSDGSGGEERQDGCGELHGGFKPEEGKRLRREMLFERE